MKKILVITGSRAEYGLLRLLLKKLKKIKKFNTKLLVTGSHLSKKHGYTISEIINDKINIDYKIDIKSQHDLEKKITDSVSIILKKISSVYSKDRPDLLIILGDRYELLAPAFAALVFRIPIAHIHGGEVTNGAYDDAIRHSISKMSNLHFVSNLTYKNRLIQLGEISKDIHITGGMGVDAIKNLKLYKKADLEKIIKIKFGKKNLIVTLHPETKSPGLNKIYIENLLKALSKLTDTTIIFTCANADNDNLIINQKIKKFTYKNLNSHFFFSLGQKKYLSCLKYLDAVIGNSSSGILEAPSFKIATINIGNRQDGRVMASSVINTDYKSKAIHETIKKVYSNSFKKILKSSKNPYGNGGATDNIINILLKNKRFSIKKKFNDLGFNENK